MKKPRKMGTGFGVHWAMKDTYAPIPQTKTYVSGALTCEALTEHVAHDGALWHAIKTKHGIEIYCVVADLETFCGHAHRLQLVNPALVSKLRSYFNNGQRALELV